MPTSPKTHRQPKRCAVHRLAKPDNRQSAGARGYDARWRALQASYKRAHPFCECCLTHGRYVEACDIHHKTAISDGGARLDWANLTALCRSCHRRATLAEIEARKNRQNMPDIGGRVESL